MYLNIYMYIDINILHKRLQVIMKMSEKDLIVRNDRSYLCLIAIYVIHAILLNVFLQPQIDVRNSVTLSPMYVRRSMQYLSETSRNGSYLQVEVTRNVDSVSTIINSTSNLQRNSLETHNDDYSGESTTDSFLHQSKSSGANLRFLTSPKISEVSSIAINAVDTIRKIIKNLSPAALGILSGCLVFFLTFTENEISSIK